MMVQAMSRRLKSTPRLQILDCEVFLLRNRLETYNVVIIPPLNTGATFQSHLLIPTRPWRAYDGVQYTDEGGWIGSMFTAVPAASAVQSTPRTAHYCCPRSGPPHCC